MQNIFSGDILNVTSFNKGFVMAAKVVNSEGKEVVRYLGYDADTKALMRIKKQVYLKIKFGYMADAIAEWLKDYVSCDSAFLPDGKIMVVFPNGKYSIFNTNGTESVSSVLSYRDATACDITVDNENVWNALPADNSVMKFSPKEGRMLLKIGGGGDTSFDWPSSVTLSGSSLYVCNRASKKIVILNTETYEVKDYRVFNEHVIKYISTQGLEFVWLDTGLYELN